MISNEREYRVNRRNTIELGYVIIPSNIDESARDQYVETCLNTERVAVLTINGEYILKAFVDKFTLQNIHFPKTNTEVGSTVVLITEPYYNQAFVVATVNRGDDSQCTSEGQYVLRKEWEGKVVSIIPDAKNGNLSISVESNDDSNGDVFIDVFNASKTSKFNLNVSGDINIRSSGDTNILAKGNVKIDSEKEITLGGKGDENVEINRAVLGDMLMNEFVNPLFDAIQQMVLTSPSGPTTPQPVNWAQFQQIKDNFEEKVLSKLNKLE